MKVTALAIFAILFFVTVLSISVMEIRAHYVISKQIAQQERDISNLQNQKDYYSSSNYEDNSQRDGEGNYGNSGDLIFTEE